MRYQLTALSLIALATAVNGVPVLSAPNGLPNVGDIYGPAHPDHWDTLLAKLKTTCITLKGIDYCHDHLIDLFFEAFQTKKDMYSYLQSKVTSDSVVLKTDAAALEGKYLEVLTS